MSSPDEYNCMEVPVVYPTILSPPSNGSDRGSGDNTYMVNDVNGTIRRWISPASPTTTALPLFQTAIDYGTVGQAYGMTSVLASENEEEGDPTRVIICTSPVTDRIMALSRMQLQSDNHNDDSDGDDEQDGTPHVIHVNFQECQMLTLPIVRVQTCWVPKDDDTAEMTTLETGSTDTIHIIQVVVVDAAANIITMRFQFGRKTTFRPVDCCGTHHRPLTSTLMIEHPSQLCHSIRCFTVSSRIMNETHQNNTDKNHHHHHYQNYHHRVTKDMISFASPDVIILAYNPYLLAIHVRNETMEFWSVASTMIRQEKFRPAPSVMSSLWTNLIGGTTANDAVVVSEMARGPCDIPVAAVTLCQDTTHHTTSGDTATMYHVFTLHSDRMIRHWTMTCSSLQPISVYAITSRHLPHPSLWSSDTLFQNSVSMHARVYDANGREYDDADNMSLLPMSTATTGLQRYVLIVQIQTSTPISYEAAVIPVLDDSQRPLPKESTTNLIAMEGTAFADGRSDPHAVATPSSIRLTVPEMATDLISMQLETNYDYINKVEDPVLHMMFYSSLTGTSMIGSYFKASNISIFSKEPMIWSDNDPTQSLYMDSIVRNEFKRIDQLLFYNDCINDKMGHSDMTTASSSTDIESEIDQRYMQHLFRPMYPRGNGTVLPPHPRHIYKAMKVVFPSSTIISSHQSRRVALTTSGTIATTSGVDVEVDVYHFIQEWRQRDQRYLNSNLLSTRQGQIIATNSADEVSGPNQNDDDGIGTTNMKERFQKEDERWRLFLHQILQQEQGDHVPLSILFFSSRTNFANNDDKARERTGKSDRALIVRPGYISMLTCNGKHLDNKRNASKLDQLSYELLCDTEYAAYISMFDMQMEEAIINNILDIANVVDRTLNIVRPSERLVHKIKDFLALDRESISLHLTGNPTDSSPWYCGNLSTLGNVPMVMASSVSMDRQKPATNRNHQRLMDIHTRLSATALLVRNLDTTRHLAFTRVFILSNTDVSSAKSVLIHRYLHTTAVMYAATRMVPSSAITKHMDTFRRWSISSISDIRGTSNDTIWLDPLLMHLSKELPRNLSTSSFCTIPMALVHLGLQLCLSRIGLSSSASHLPELDMLFMNSDEIEYPSLALRLLSIRDAIQIENDDQAAAYRKILIAMCLINVSRSKKSTTAATTMFKRALSMLPIDASNPEVAMNNLRILESQIGDNHIIGGAMLADHIREAIDDASSLEWNSEVDSLLARLHTALFNVSVSMENWDGAYGAFASFPSHTKRREKFHRLARAMVNSGALSELLNLIQANTNESADNLYDLAVEALSKMTFHDIYSSMVVDPTVPTDYVGALYALHASQGQWKLAAQAMDIRYANARAALQVPVTGLSTAQHSKREQIIIDDLTLGALGCLYSMEKIQDASSKYLISIVNYAHESKMYMPMNAIALRGKRSQVLKKLYDDKSGDPSFAVRAFAADSLDPSISDSDIVDQLFFQGFILSGIELAICMDKATDAKPRGRPVLFDIVSRLVRDYLLPLALDPYQTPKRPTIHQLHAAIDYMKGSNHNVNTTLVAHRSSKYSDLEQGPLRTGAMLLVEMLTVKYTTQESPLANEVASDMLCAHRRHTPLPMWLEELLLTGTNNCYLPGLFSRRHKPGIRGYLGDPIVLLDIYTARGMAKDACRVVSRVFNDFNNNCGHLVASRLSEKGEIDFIPFDKIKLLWCLIDIRLEKIRLDSFRRDLESARMKMKESMDEYFKQMKITEMGQQSARAL